MPCLVKGVTESLEKASPVPASQLITACTRSWIVDGAGHWSDVRLGKPSVAARHRLLTERLREALDTGLLAAVNGPLTSSGP